MDIPANIGKLTALFQKFGAPDPESWAASQVEEGIPQLQRFLFLRRPVLTRVSAQCSSAAASAAFPTRT